MRMKFLSASAFSLSVALSVGSAHADTQRQRHLPYVRAASDCIAASVRRDYGFADAVQSNDFKAPIGRAVDACRAELYRMVAAHDEIYGSGGYQFLTGDYAADIDRAVRNRLASQITETRSNLARAAEQRAAAEVAARAGRIEAENRARAAQAEKLSLAKKSQSLISARMYECIGKEAASMLLTNETAEVVAKAAMVFCRTEVDAMASATIDVIETETGETGSRGARRQQADTVVRNLVTAQIVKARGAMLATRATPPSVGDTAVAPPKSY